MIATEGAALLKERYGVKPGFFPHANAMIEQLLSHRTVRAFTDQPVSEETVQTIVAAAQSASTSSNLQTWSVVWVTDPERKAALAAVTGRADMVMAAPCLLMWIADLARLHGVAAGAGIEAEAVDYLEMFLVAAIDAALAAQNAAVAAEAMGLGVVYIGAMRKDPLLVAGVLGLPKRSVAVFGMSLGYPDPARPAAIKPRLSQDVVLHRDTYHTPSPEAVADYDAVMAEFYARENMPQQSWSVHSGNRVKGAESLSGRHRMKEMLQALGFLLK